MTQFSDLQRTFLKQDTFQIFSFFLLIFSLFQLTFYYRVIFFIEFILFISFEFHVQPIFYIQYFFPLSIYYKFLFTLSSLYVFIFYINSSLMPSSLYQIWNFFIIILFKKKKQKSYNTSYCSSLFNTNIHSAIIFLCF